MFTKIAKVVGWIVAGIVALVVLLYLGVVAINWRDKEPSEAAVRFESLHRDRPAVADQDNAYIYMMGLGAAPSEDAYQVGLRRKVWLEMSRPLGRFEKEADPHGDIYDLRKDRSKELTALLDQCRPGDSRCAAEFDRGEAVLKEWLKTEGWLLERYQSLLNVPQWLEPSPYDVEEPLPPYQVALDGQRLLLAKALLLAKSNDARGARALIEQDIRFWRNVLQSSDLLISKMIATVALTRQFELGNVVLRQLSGAKAIDAMPASWRQALSKDEYSMLRCFVGEWKFSSAVLHKLERTGDLSTATFTEEHRAWIGKITDALFLPLFQYQDTTNKSAEHLLAVTQALDAPFDEFKMATEKSAAISEQYQSDAFPPKSAYNPVGNALLGISSVSYLKYAKRVMDIEGTRRAALAAAMLRQRGIKPDAVAAELKSLDVRNPYDNEPFEWDEATGSIVFTGLAEDDRRVHKILY